MESRFELTTSRLKVDLIEFGWEHVTEPKSMNIFACKLLRNKWKSNKSQSHLKGLFESATRNDLFNACKLFMLLMNSLLTVDMLLYLKSSPYKLLALHLLVSNAMCSRKLLCNESTWSFLNRHKKNSKSNVAKLLSLSDKFFKFTNLLWLNMSMICL